MEETKISCVLITREEYFPEIILDRLDLDFFDEILIYNKCSSVYHRYLSAAKAKNDLIYVQDDDCMVNYQVLFQKFDGRLTNTMTKEFQKKYEDKGCTLVGWGCYFPKSMLSVFDKYIAKYGVDQHLLREADRIFTHLNKPWNTVIQPHEDLFQDESRMGYQQNHEESAREAIDKCKVL